MPYTYVHTYAHISYGRHPRSTFPLPEQTSEHSIRHFSSFRSPLSDPPVFPRSTPLTPLVVSQSSLSVLDEPTIFPTRYLPSEIQLQSLEPSEPEAQVDRVVGNNKHTSCILLSHPPLFFSSVCLFLLMEFASFLPRCFLKDSGKVMVVQGLNFGADSVLGVFRRFWKGEMLKGGGDGFLEG